MTPGVHTRWSRSGARTLVLPVVAAIVAAGFAATGSAAPRRSAAPAGTTHVAYIRITKKTDQSSPELMNNFNGGTAGLGAHGRFAQVWGTISCTGGLGKQHLARIRVKIAQYGVVAEGFTLARCTGNVEPWTAVAITHGSKRLRRGSATGHAWVGVPLFGSGMRKAAYDWSHSLTLLP